MNPLMTLYDQVAESVYAHEAKVSKEAVDEKVFNALSRAGFPEPKKFYDSYPHQLSGGMRQRAMLAISLVLEPKLILADEPTTALDAELQVQVIYELRKRLEKDCSIIFISHDLGVIRNVSDKLAVMYAGNLIEFGSTAAILDNPLHPYTKDLINALPRLVEDKIMPQPIPGTLPAPDKKPVGCVYSDRCRRAQKKCHKIRPELEPIGEGRFVNCFFPLDKGPAYD